MRKYRLVAKKGEGTFSEVLKAQNVKDGRYHAIKCMKNRFESIDQVNNLREIQALRRLSPHEHIISLEEVLYDQPTGRLALVFELMDANLYELIRGRRHYLNPTLIKSYMWQLMKSLDHMHRKGIFHRDIKPENILIESTGEMGKGLKLADFGSCRGIYSKQPYTEYISTRWYRAPECLLTDGYYGPEMDMWGAGCVMFEITSLYPLFPGSNEIDQVNRIHKVLGTPTQELLGRFKAKGASHISFDFPPQKGIGIQQLVPHASPDSVDLMVKLLKYDAAERISAKEAMRHAYFKDIRDAEAKQQAEGPKLPPQANTMPSAAPAGGNIVSQPPTQGGGFGMEAGKGALGASQGVGAGGNKNLPSINNHLMNPGAEQAGHYGNKVMMTNNGTENQYHTQHGQQQLLMMQKQQQVAKGTGASQMGASSLPPIIPLGSQNLSMNAQNNKYGEPKLSGRSNAPSVNHNNSTNAQTKKRKKYRMNHVQQQRVAQNSESVMRAYGVPKYFGASGGEGASSNVAGMAPMVGQYQVRNYAQQQGNKKF